LIFPAIGLLLLSFWWKSHRSYQLTGPMELTLDPYPGSLGGQVGGVITLAKPLRQTPRNSTLTLQCVRNYRSGKESREEVLWEQSMVPRWEGGRRLQFCFDVPESEPASSPPYSRPGYEWKIQLNAKLDNKLTIKREYTDLPVFQTQQRSSIRDPSAIAATSLATQKIHSARTENVLNLQMKADGYHLQFPAFRNKWGIALGVIGLIFVVVGLLIPDIIFNIVFPLLGLPVALAGIYAFINSLDIRFGPEGITTQRRLLNLPAKSSFLPSYAFQEFIRKKTHSTKVGNKVTQYYSILAIGNQGEKLVVAEDLKGRAEAEAAIEKLESVLHYR
jgi:hypothetical protein